MSEYDAVFGSLAMLIGGKITAIVHDDLDGEKVYGLWIEQTKQGKKITKVFWILSDFEGNAPGGFSIEEQ